MILSHLEIAVLMRVNELADRYGVKPYEFSTSFYLKDGKCHLGYDTAPEDDPQGKKYERMLEAVGAQNGDELVGDYRDIIEKLDQAIKKTPRPRSR